MSFYWSMIWGMNFCSADVFTLCFVPVESLCFVNVWRLMFGLCVIAGTITDCIEYWLLKWVLAWRLVNWHFLFNITLKIVLCEIICSSLSCFPFLVSFYIRHFPLCPYVPFLLKGMPSVNIHHLQGGENKVKLSLCLIMHHARRVHGGGGVAVCIIPICTT